MYIVRSVQIFEICVNYIEKITYCLLRWSAIKLDASGLANYLSPAELAKAGNLSEYDGMSITVGLWKSCKEEICSPLPSCSEGELDRNSCQKMMIARAFITMTCVLSAVGALVLIITGILGASNALFIMATRGLPIVTFVTGLIGIALTISFTKATDENYRGMYRDSVKLGAAAISAIVAMIMTLFVVIIAFFIRPKATYTIVLIFF
ncbi:hypothetical protein I4U23_015206 [Adineta vaga]|nr:hypothetical protein I4U23_015206 [Adineta vaga]